MNPPGPPGTAPAAGIARVPLAAAGVLLAGAYIAVALGAILLSRESGKMATLWYANAMAVVFFQFRPSRDWAVLTGALAVAVMAVNALTGKDFGLSLLFLLGNGFEVLLGAALLLRFCSPVASLEDVGALLKVLLLGGVVPPFFGALIAAAALSAGGVDDFLAIWLIWFEGSALGAIALLPLGMLLLVRGGRSVLQELSRPAVALGLVAVLAVAGGASLWAEDPYIYLLASLVLLAAIGHMAGAASAVLLVSVVAGTLVARGAFGPAAETGTFGEAVFYLPLILTLVPPVILAASLERTRLALRRLAESEARFRQLYRATPAMMHSVDLRGKLLSVSDAWCRRLGYLEEEVIGRSPLEFMPPESRQKAAGEIRPRLELEGQIRNAELQILTKAGETIDVRLSAVWQRSLDGELLQALAVLTDVTEEKRLAEKMAHLAHHDSLTGLPNRMCFEACIQQACANGHRHHDRFAVLYMDLDRFKHINDTLGHGVGDELLKAVAQRLSAALRDSDMVSRVGGDEFVMLVKNLCSREDAGAIARKLVRRVAQPVLVGNATINVSISLGIAVYPDDGKAPATLIKHADQAMYRAKHNGRNQFCFFSEASPQEPAVERP